MVWAIASREDEALVRAWAEDLDLDLPVLLDTDGAAIGQYNMTMAFPTGAYPQEWLIDREGKIAYVANRYQADSLIAAIEDALEE